MWLRLNFLFLAGGLSLQAADHSTLPAECLQCVIVTTASWKATNGQLQLAERFAGEEWHLAGPAVPVRVGKQGLAWGRGVLSVTGFSGPKKREGDDKAPAGVFRLGPAFGYAAGSPTTKMPYLPLSPQIVGVDDPQSRYYNQLIDESRIRSIDWRSAEKMILSDDRYKWGVVVQHNVSATPGAGSCIFLHVWKDAGTATTGCTAMPERAMLDLIHRLDPARRPLLIQLPAPLYNELHGRWNLPALP
jgi:D-alanyl-D-alanine dipeptidase